MPGATTRRTLTRQWELLKLLPSNGAGKTAAQLTEELNDAGFRVSKRQVERDLGNLMEAFPIDRNDASIPYGWRWVRHASLHLPGLALPEALSLHLVDQMLRPLLPAAVLEPLEPLLRMAATKLESAQGLPLARWANKVRTVPPALPLRAPQVDPGALEAVQQGLLQERQIEAHYQAADASDAQPLTLHPLGLVQRGPVAYLVATAFGYDDLRLYALHRFTHATLADEPARRPEGFDLDAYIAGGALQFTSTGKTLRLVLAVDETAERILRETALSADQEIRIRAGRTTVHATVPDSWQLRWWILGQGDLVEVLKPAALRREIADTCQRMAALYTARKEQRT
ncbi:helix-turn-helix transcriptional regulator [Thioalkalivibrio paradoxus]|uniref:Transcriptional regulator n=1 Tax=Thioalkalivibrio paradoxus ARh 1 TaxID=713585 RepID=W0DRQ5_9GAMM|nr:WYL domain-containing protein [Thioalkalivibrio paradoxus]AHE99653.1 transcriptional regulator [Thioalkalivibrio paradoxus ARh 1]